MPTIHIAGINHFNPFCRQRIVHWLEEVREKSGQDSPCFVAVEFDDAAHREVVIQRNNYRNSIRDVWPHLSPENTELLVQGLGYEGDAHRTVFPETDVIWLDQGRACPEIATFASDHLIKYRVDLALLAMKGVQLDPADPHFLQRLIAEGGALLPEEPFVAGERDKLFADRIVGGVQNCGAGWAAVIVGCRHAEYGNGSMIDILQATGIDLQPTLLT